MKTDTQIRPDETFDNIRQEKGGSEMSKKR